MTDATAWIALAALCLLGIRRALLWRDRERQAHQRWTDLAIEDAALRRVLNR